MRIPWAFLATRAAQLCRHIAAAATCHGFSRRLAVFARRFDAFQTDERIPIRTMARARRVFPLDVDAIYEYQSDVPLDSGSTPAGHRHSPASPRRWP
jgi:hypothetical protein